MFSLSNVVLQAFFSTDNYNFFSVTMKRRKLFSSKFRIVVHLFARKTIQILSFDDCEAKARRRTFQETNQIVNNGSTSVFKVDQTKNKGSVELSRRHPELKQTNRTCWTIQTHSDALS